MDEYPRPQCFQNQLKQILKKFSKAQTSIEKNLSDIKRTLIGDTIPGFSPFILKKLRLPITEHGIGKSKGLRVVYLVNEQTKKIMMVAIYIKSDYPKGSDMLKMLKEHIKLIQDALN